ncbi:MAG: hypothetical protein HOH95_14940 [Dehalococcoidia bacterium]|jgi:transposase-like protein|nr:hypothetical protein [Dehalococcoidia bacterium]MBT7095830.1 hypothetical protein [Candidatus Poribacteria bacterium]
MRWNSKLPMAGALGAMVIGGVAMTAPVGASEAVTETVTTVAVQQAVDGEESGRGPEHGRSGRGHRGGGDAGVAEQLGIDAETFRDAVRAVMEERRDSGAEKPEGLTAEEREAHRAEFISDVAAELGISAAELEAAFDGAFEARLAQGVEDGKLTQAEADEILEAKANGTLDELRQERKIESVGDRLEQMLSDGIIDQSQYDALQAELNEGDLEGFQELMRETVGERDGGRGHGPRRGGPDGGPRHGGTQLGEFGPADEGVSL